MSTGQDRLDKERDVWEAFKDEHIEDVTNSSANWITNIHVDRCIRIIDQAIQEQQHASLAPICPPILLPDIAAPRKLPPAILDDFLDAPPPKPIIRRKKSKKGRKTDTGADNVPSVRPTPPLIPNPDPNEPRYCYCDQISHGEMIACDDKKCEREWFHLVCTGLETAPEGPKKWYCDDCIERRKRRK